MNALSEHRVKIQQYQILTHSALGGCTFLATIFIIYFFRKPIKKLANCIIPCCKIRNRGIKLQPTAPIDYELDITKLAKQSELMKTEKSEQSSKLTKIPINIIPKNVTSSKNSKSKFPVFA